MRNAIRTAETFLHILRTGGKERFIACLRRGVVEELAKKYVEEVLGEDFESYLRAETERRYLKAVADLEAKIKLLKEESLWRELSSSRGSSSAGTAYGTARRL